MSYPRKCKVCGDRAHQRYPSGTFYRINNIPLVARFKFNLCLDCWNQVHSEWFRLYTKGVSKLGAFEILSDMYSNGEFYGLCEVPVKNK